MSRAAGLVGRALGAAIDAVSQGIDEADMRSEIRHLREEAADLRKRLNAALTKIDQMELEIEARRLVDTERRTTTAGKE